MCIYIYIIYYIYLYFRADVSVFVYASPVCSSLPPRAPARFSVRRRAADLLGSGYRVQRSGPFRAHSFGVLGFREGLGHFGAMARNCKLLAHGRGCARSLVGGSVCIVRTCRTVCLSVSLLVPPHVCWFMSCHTDRGTFEPSLSFRLPTSMAGVAQRRHQANWGEGFRLNIGLNACRSCQTYSLYGSLLAVGRGSNQNGFRVVAELLLNVQVMLTYYHHASHSCMLAEVIQQLSVLRHQQNPTPESSKLNHQQVQYYSIIFTDKYDSCFCFWSLSC